MNILNRKNHTIFLLVGFMISLIFIGFETPATAQASIEDAMRDLGCNTAKNCDAFCDLPENNSSGICDAYWEFAGNLSELENTKKRLDYCTTTEECNTYCETHGDWDCREYYGLQNDTAGLGKLINKMRKAEQAWLAGGGPGGCNSKYSCLLYCGTHFEECKSFTIDGFDATYAQPATFHSGIQSVVALKKGLEDNISLPKACQPDYVNGHIGCLTYCGDSIAADCVDYKKKTDFLSTTDAAILDLKVQGKTPGAGNPRYNNGCSSLQSCESYCGERSHVNECLAFAEKYGLIVTPKELTIYRKIAPLAVRGLTPTFGTYCGIECVCTSVQACRAACDQPENYTQCAEVADKLNLIEEDVPPDKKAVFAAMQKGESPGQCKDEASCRTYCEDIDHIEECVNFVEKFNLASSDELKEIRQMADVKKAGVAFPGNCKTKESCLKYCDSDANTIECVGFAAGVGFMTKEEADIVKRVGGKGPGNCRSREACDSYCKDEAHIDECVDFAVKAGFISEGDAADAKKYKITSGPGGCKSKADCEAFCVLPENQDICFQFAKDHGMISEEDLKNIEQYRNQGPPDFSQVNPKWLACMEKEMGSAAFGRFKAGKSDRSDVSAIQAAQKQCQSEMGPDTAECLTKTTCEEFVSCLNPSDSRTSQQGGPEQKSPPEIKKRMDTCQDELKETKKKEIDEKMDACLSRSCSEFDACLKSVQQGSSEGQQAGQQQDQGTPNPKLNAKINACQKEKINACLSKPCGEFQACLNALGGGGEGGSGDGTPDPAVLAKVKSCQPPPPPSEGGQQQSGDQSQIPQGFSSWEAFCRANSGDSRCAAYVPKIQQQYPLLIDHSFLGAMLRYLLK